MIFKVVLYAHKPSTNLVGQSFQYFFHSFIQDKLNLPIRDFYLPIGLRVVRCGYLMCYGIFSHKSFKSSIAKMWVIITNYCTRGSKAWKDVFIQEFDNNFVVICLTRDGFNPFGYIIHSPQDVLVAKWIRKGSHKVDAQTLKSSTSRIGLRGIILRFEILPIIWHPVHILQKLNASLNKVS